MATLTTSGLESRADERDRAVGNLEDAMDEQARWAETYEQSLGTPRELEAYVRLRQARGRVAACDRWLQWVDDEGAVVAPPADEVPLEQVLGH
jgi:hypothetical protein